MSEPGTTSSRKLDHVRINLERDVGSGLTTGLERFRFIHRALPEVDLDSISTAGTFLGRGFDTPLLISSMTGGAEGLEDINLRLAEAAQECGVVMGVGSQRAAIERDTLAGSFQVRQVAPYVPLLANLGAIQLNYGYGVDECRRAVEMIAADALILHLNPLQEALQPEGDTQWAGLLERIAAVVSALEVPVVVKEVGWGISAEDARRLAEIGVAAIDVAGAGGTSWSEVEKHRAPTAADREVAGRFVGWGIPTADSLRAVRHAAPSVALIASGGLRDGIDVAKTVALGATLSGMASPFLKAAAESTEAIVEQIDIVTRTLRVAMFAVGASDLAALRDTEALVERIPR